MAQTQVTKTHYFLYAVGLILVGLALMSGYSNFEAHTLTKPLHGGTVLALGLAGLFCLYSANHSRDVALNSLPAVPGPQGPPGPPGLGVNLDIVAKLVEDKLIALLPAALQPAAKIAEPIVNKMIDKVEVAVETKAGAVVQEVKDVAGKYLVTTDAKQDIESLFHLAEQAVNLDAPELKTKMLDSLRELNDLLFVKHHDVTTSPDKVAEVKNDPNAVKVPGSPA